MPAASAKPKEVLDLAANMVPPGRGWAWNEAVMEFGALRCTARRPVCRECPLGAQCKARPRMQKALAAAPRVAKGASRYVDTNRYLRGRVLALLREEAPPGGVGLPELARGLRGKENDVEPVRLMEVVGSLERDGLARVTRPAERAEAHQPGAVAEERAPYAAGPGRDGPDEIRVSLP